jgi:hypothetical protein
MKSLGRIAAIAIVLAPLAVSARQQVEPLHTVTWYAMNQGAREATLRWCHSSAERQAMYDCQNAAAGANMARYRDGRDPLAVWDRSSYYSANPVARTMIQSACANPMAPGAGPYLRYCGVAR